MLASADALRLAAILDLLAEEKLAAVEPGAGPGALHVMESPTIAPLTHDKGDQAIPAPTMGKGAPPSDPKTQMANDLHTPPGGGGTQQTSLPGGSTKQAGAMIRSKLLGASIRKLAEDATNPAQISAGSAASTMLERSASGENPVPVPANASQIQSSEAATNMTHQSAKAQERKDLHAEFDASKKDTGSPSAFTHSEGQKMASDYLSRLEAGLVV